MATSSSIPTSSSSNATPPLNLNPVWRTESLTISSRTNESFNCTYSLQNTTPKHVVFTLIHAFQSGTFTPQEAQVIHSALAKIGIINVERAELASKEKAQNIRRHCVRCHCLYLEADNGVDVCREDHQLPYYMTTTDQYKTRSRIVFPCCGTDQCVFNFGNRPPLHRARHTSDANGVVYHGENGVIKACDLDEKGICKRSPVFNKALLDSSNSEKSNIDLVGSRK